MKFKRLPLGIYQANCYVIWDGKTKKSAIIDPGGDFQSLNSFIQKNNLNVEFIILTHGHADHIGAVIDAKEQYNAKVLIHNEDYEMLKNKNINHSDKMGYGIIEVEADKKLEENHEIKIGSTILSIIHTPGHTRGSICIRTENVLFSGDTLFAGSIGRTDLEGGSFEDIIKSIKEKIITLPDDTQIYPGHGSSTTVIIEKKSNPFL